MAVARWYAPVAQLDSAIDSDSIGRRFEPCRAYQVKSYILISQNVAFFTFSNRKTPTVLYFWHSESESRNRFT